MVETQMNHDKTVTGVERNVNVEDLEESSSSIVYSELNDDEEKDLNASKLLDATSSHAFYGYEEAAPQVQQRHEQNKPYRRNSIVNQIMTWAGAIRDDDFYNSSNTNFTNHKTKNTRSLEQQTSRRASLHGSAPTTQIQPNSRLNPLRQRVASSDDVTLLDHNDGLEQGDDCNIEGDDDEGGFRRHYDHPNRRNSLHAMIERAMAHVNQTKNYDDDDLTPFGNRRDSLF